MITLIIVIVTCLVSVLAFRKREILFHLDLSPSRIINSREYYRLFTHAFLHADYMHLIINMLVLYSFGIGVEAIFERLEDQGLIFSGKIFFILLYVGGILISSISTVIKKKNNPEDSALKEKQELNSILAKIGDAPIGGTEFNGILEANGVNSIGDIKTIELAQKIKSAIDESL